MALLDELKTSYNEALYENVSMLTLVYPPEGYTKQLLKYLKKDMFLKNNSTGFQFLIYYLLYTHNPGVIKNKISAWPIVDIKDEYNFRKQILEYLDFLHKDHPDHIPKVLASHLIAPGGFKFIRFMWKISRFALLQSVLRISKDNSKIILQFKAGNWTTSGTTKIINKQNSNLYKEFDAIIAQNKIESDRLLNEITRITKTNETLEKEIKSLEDDKINKSIKYNENVQVFDTSNLQQVKKYCDDCKDFNIIQLKTNIQAEDSLTTTNHLLEHFKRLMEEKIYSMTLHNVSPSLTNPKCEELEYIQKQLQIMKQDLSALEVNLKKTPYKI